MVNKLKNFLVTFVSTYVALLSATWGVFEASTYFSGDSLRTVLGKWWWVAFYFVPFLISLLHTYTSIHRTTELEGKQTKLHKSQEGLRDTSGLEEVQGKKNNSGSTQAAKPSMAKWVVLLFCFLIPYAFFMYRLMPRLVKEHTAPTATPTVEVPQPTQPTATPTVETPQPTPSLRGSNRWDYKGINISISGAKIGESWYYGKALVISLNVVSPKDTYLLLSQKDSYLLDDNEERYIPCGLVTEKDFGAEVVTLSLKANEPKEILIEFCKYTGATHIKLFTLSASTKQSEKNSLVRLEFTDIDATFGNS